MNNRLPLAVAFALACCAAARAQDLDKAMKSITQADLKKHQTYLASDALEGREAGSDGGHKAAMYIVDEITRLKLMPAGDQWSYFQPFGPNMVWLDHTDTNVLRLYKDKAQKDADLFRLKGAMMPMKVCPPGGVAAEIVFAGYGVTAPEYGYDDYKALKFKDPAIVMIFDHEPQERDPASKWNGDKPTKYSDWDHKITNAEKNGAAALLILMDSAHARPERGIPAHDWLNWPPMPDEQGMYPPPKYKIPVAYLTVEAAEAIFAAASKKIEDVHDEIDRTLKPASFKVSRPGRLDVTLGAVPGKCQKNIVAMWPGSDEQLRQQVVVLGAHYDHLGYGNFGSNGGKIGQVHNGADDNASGTSALLEIAEAVTMLKPKRTVVFIWFDAEEKGLLGSSEWTSRPTMQFAEITAMINLDMIGRNAPKDIKVGLEKDATTNDWKYKKLFQVLTEAEANLRVKFDYNYCEQQKLLQRSDHWPFMQQGVPAVFFTGGLHPDYHTDRDDPDKVNYAKEENIGRIVLWLMYRLTNFVATCR